MSSPPSPSSPVGGSGGPQKLNGFHQDASSALPLLPLKSSSPHKKGDIKEDPEDDNDDEDDEANNPATSFVLPLQNKPNSPSLLRKLTWPTVMMLLSLCFTVLGFVALARAGYLDRRAESTSASSSVPQYFQTTPEIYAGPTKTGVAPFLVETNPAPFGKTDSFVANAPLETAIPIVGNTQNQSIFHLMGQLSPYFPNPSGFGIPEYPLPAGASVTQLHTLHRHGSRYPTANASVQLFGQALTSIIQKKTASFNGSLSFVNSWSYGLGYEILVPVGRQELFDSGVLHYYDYAHLYNTSTKILARTTTQDRMLKSAEYFMAGFFGLSWTNNASLVVIIEGDNYNNSLAGYDNCNNSNIGVASGGTNASAMWQKTYLTDAVKRFNAETVGFTWNTSTVYNAQTLCPYETVAYGYSAWCDLFTYQEWEGFEYSIDLSFAGNNYFQSPTGRAVGIGWVQEFLARIENHLLVSRDTQANITLDSMNSTFPLPLTQNLFFDFTHDTNLAAILTALSIKQFAPELPVSGPPKDQQLIVSHLQPFGARIDIEIITSPHPLPANRTTATGPYSDAKGPETFYIHFLINQRTLPLGVSFPECGNRQDGWCELQAFLDVQKNALKKAEYDFSCNGKYAPVSYGSVTDGVPLATPPPKS